MKIAITGGTGFLGKHLVEDLIDKNHTPIVLTRSLKNKVNNECEYRVTDYSIEDLIKKFFDIDAVVHLAAKRGSQGNISEFHDNEVLTQNLYEACYKINIKNIVYASSISVYSDEELLPWVEEDVPSPKLMYGVSKLTCEYIGDIYSAKKGLCIKNLRFAHLYGFNEKNNYMINLFFRQAFNQQQLVINEKSIAKREFLYVKDAAKAITCALTKNNLSGTFNVGSSEAFTNSEVAEIINNVFQNNGNLSVKNPDKIENIQSSYMDSSKIKEVLDFHPDYMFVDAVSEIYSLMRGLDHVPIRY